MAKLAVLEVQCSLYQTLLNIAVVRTRNCDRAPGAHRGVGGGPCHPHNLYMKVCIQLKKKVLKDNGPCCRWGIGGWMQLRNFIAVVSRHTQVFARHCVEWGYWSYASALNSTTACRPGDKVRNVIWRDKIRNRQEETRLEMWEEEVQLEICQEETRLEMWP